jgi:zinc protease
MSECLLRGTQSKTREQISETIEDLGGHLSAYSGNNAFGLQAKCLSSDLDIVSELLADCLLNPSFPEAELEKERTLQTAAIQKQEERPMFLAQQALRKAIFANHPYQWDRHGTVASIKGITRKQIQQHHAKHVVSQNLVISIFGDISQTEATERAQKLFADTPPGTVAAQPHADAAPELPIRIVQEVPQKQAIVLVGFPAVSIFDPRNDALNLLQTAMSGLSSDLAISVRDKRGLAYYVGAYQQPGVDPGMFVIYAGTQRASADAVEALYKEEIKRITTEGLRNDEVDAAKNRIIADHDMQLQNNLHVALTCGLNELYGLGFDYAFSTAERINALTAKTVREASESILNTNRMAVSVLLPEVGPEDK